MFYSEIIPDCAPHSPQFSHHMQLLYDRHDLLCDACWHIEQASEALGQSRDADQGENLAALEQIGGALIRERDLVHAQLERLERLEQA